MATKILPYVAPRDEAIEAGDAEVVDLLALDSTCRAMRRLAAALAPEAAACRRRRAAAAAAPVARGRGFSGGGRNRGRLRGPCRAEDLSRVEVLCGRRLLEFRLSVLRHHDGQDSTSSPGTAASCP